MCTVSTKNGQPYLQMVVAVPNYQYFAKKTLNFNFFVMPNKSSLIIYAF